MMSSTRKKSISKIWLRALMKIWLRIKSSKVCEQMPVSPWIIFRLSSILITQRSVWSKLSSNLSARDFTDQLQYQIKLSVWWDWEGIYYYEISNSVLHNRKVIVLPCEIPGDYRSKLELCPEILMHSQNSLGTRFFINLILAWKVVHRYQRI